MSHLPDGEIRRRPIVAIDGPAGAGKTTTAREVAGRLGFIHLDTGAMYRAIALQALRDQCDLTDLAAIAAVAENVWISIKFERGLQRVYLGEDDVTDLIRSPEVTRAVTPVCEVAQVRRRMVGLQRQLGAPGGIVAEGRDIGTVVFPDAELKIFLTANLRIRAERRIRDLQRAGIQAEVARTVEEIDYRDQRDASREEGPLKQAADAIVIDTTELTIADQVEAVLQAYVLKCG
ncbi:MAG: (d)CMP kinase [bacterium]|nr:(d)CMP kinase [bacterium]